VIPIGFFRPVAWGQGPGSEGEREEAGKDWMISAVLPEKWGTKLEVGVPRSSCQLGGGMGAVREAATKKKGKNGRSRGRFRSFKREKAYTSQRASPMSGRLWETTTGGVEKERMPCPRGQSAGAPATPHAAKIERNRKKGRKHRGREISNGTAKEV